MIAFQIAAPGEISLARIYGLKLEPLSSRIELMAHPLSPHRYHCKIN